MENEQQREKKIEKKREQLNKELSKDIDICIRLLENLRDNGLYEYYYAGPNYNKSKINRTRLMINDILLSKERKEHEVI